MMVMVTADDDDDDVTLCWFQTGDQPRTPTYSGPHHTVMMSSAVGKESRSLLVAMESRGCSLQHNIEQASVTLIATYHMRATPCNGLLQSDTVLGDLKDVRNHHLQPSSISLNSSSSSAAHHHNHLEELLVQNNLSDWIFKGAFTRLFVSKLLALQTKQNC